jgi:hypothetical protein
MVIISQNLEILLILLIIYVIDINNKDKEYYLSESIKYNHGCELHLINYLSILSNGIKLPSKHKLKRDQTGLSSVGLDKISLGQYDPKTNNRYGATIYLPLLFLVKPEIPDIYDDAIYSYREAIPGEVF